jgi:multidrug efflux pump subunit AcrB
MMQALRRNFIFALLAMFALMAFALGSYTQPIMIMMAIPFGVVGAILGHIVLGYDISIISMMGMVALAGVVVNDSIVLTDAINTFRKEGMTVWDAVVAGGTRRFRPVILTSLTTFFGLAPMILETSPQAKFLVPMAISLGFGILFTTVIVLGVVPCFYLVADDVRKLFTKVWGKEPAEEDVVELA